MSKKDKKEKRELKIHYVPDTIFVVELNDVVLITGFPVTECIFPCYRFDSNQEGAHKAAETIASEKKKLVANAVDFDIDDPLTYDPIAIQNQIKNLVTILGAERKKIIDAHKLLDEKQMIKS